MATAVTEEQKVSPPYVAFPTFRNFLASLKGGIPARIDKSVMGNISGGAQSHLLATVKFLQLIGPQGEPQDELRQLVDAYQTDKWKEVLSALVKSSYSDVIDGLDLTTATPQQLDEKFRAAGVEGSTLDKAMRFYLTAVQESGIGHAKRLITRKKSAARRTSRKAANHTAEDEVDENDETDEMMTIPIYFKGKNQGKIIVPKSIAKKDIKMVEIAVQMVTAFAEAQDADDDES
jgi:hypothetical protein